MLNFRRRLIIRKEIKAIISFLREYIKDKNIFEIADGIELCFYTVGDNLFLTDQGGVQILFVEYFESLQEMDEGLCYLKKQLVEEGYKIHNTEKYNDFTVLYS